MSRIAEAATQSTRVAELKQFITSNTFETLEKLEEAVDAFLWGDEQEEMNSENRQYNQPCR